MIVPFIGDKDKVSTTPLFNLGYETYLETTPGDPSTRARYKYVFAVVAMTRYLAYAVNFNGNIIAALTQTTDDTAPLLLCAAQQLGGIPLNNYGWSFIGEGAARIYVVASTLLDLPLYSTATAGALSNSATTAKVVNGVKLTANVGGAPGDAPCYATDRMIITV